MNNNRTLLHSIVLVFGCTYVAFASLALLVIRSDVNGGRLYLSDWITIGLTTLFGVCLLLLALRGVEALPPARKRERKPPSRPRRGPVDGIVSLDAVRRHRRRQTHDGGGGPYAA